jgi:hypothetical protein
VNQLRAATLWGIAAVVLAAGTSVFVAGFFLVARTWVAVAFGVGVVVTVQSVGLLFVPSFAALVMAARTGRATRERSGWRAVAGTK